MDYVWYYVFLKWVLKKVKDNWNYIESKWGKGYYYSEMILW